MNPATTQRSTELPARTSTRAARSWIERQLQWERTLGVLRGRDEHPTRRAA